MRALRHRIHAFPRSRFANERGSVLLTAMLLAIIIAVGLGGYLGLSRVSLKMAQRTFYTNDALNLAEAGLEEAANSFAMMGSGVSSAWDGWTISGANAMRTLPPFNRNQNAIGLVKVFVLGYNGSDLAPAAISQATITPFDGSPPITRTLRSGLRNNITGYSMNGIVALNGLTIKGQSFADSFNSNPTNSPTGPWRPYSASIARSNTRVIVPTGIVNLGNGSILGNLVLGPGITPPPAAQVTGTIQTGFTGTFKMPAYPTPTSVSRSYNLGSAIPATLPAAGHLPASDGAYYYFCSGVTIGNTTITNGNKVVITGTNTNMGSGLTLQGTGNCMIYIDGTVTSTGVINNGSWAGALQIFTTTTSPCTIGNNGQIIACLFAPNAPLEAKGGGNSGMLVGFYVARTITTSGHMDFHYDEALQPLSGSALWQVTQWLELKSATDRAGLAALTSNYIR